MDKCPQCGYVDNASILKNKPVTAAMSVYVDPKTGAVDGAYNSNEKELVVGEGDAQRKLIRQDLFKPATLTVKEEPKK